MTNKATVFLNLNNRFKVEWNLQQTIGEVFKHSEDLRINVLFQGKQIT